MRAGTETGTVIDSDTAYLQALLRAVRAEQGTHLPLCTDIEHRMLCVAATPALAGGCRGLTLSLGVDGAVTIRAHHATITTVPGYPAPTDVADLLTRLLDAHPLVEHRVLAEAVNPLGIHPRGATCRLGRCCERCVATPGRASDRCRWCACHHQVWQRWVTAALDAELGGRWVSDEAPAAATSGEVEVVFDHDWAVYFWDERDPARQFVLSQAVDEPHYMLGAGPNSSSASAALLGEELPSAAEIVDAVAIQWKRYGPRPMRQPRTSHRIANHLGVAVVIVDEPGWVIAILPSIDAITVSTLTVKGPDLDGVPIRNRTQFAELPDPVADVCLLVTADVAALHPNRADLLMPGHAEPGTDPEVLYVTRVLFATA